MRRSPARMFATVLASWQSLNAFLRTCTDSKELRLLMRQEEAGRNRLRFLLRIHGRLTRVEAIERRAKIHKEHAHGRG